MNRETPVDTWDAFLSASIGSVAIAGVVFWSPTEPTIEPTLDGDAVGPGSDPIATATEDEFSDGCGAPLVDIEESPSRPVESPIDATVAGGTG